MALSISVDEILKVCLAGDHGDGGWYEVDEATFTIDIYSYLDATRPVPEMVPSGGVLGFRFCSDGDWLAGPLTSILAIKETDPD